MGNLLSGSGEFAKAVENGDLEKAKSLFEKGTNINSLNSGRSVLDCTFKIKKRENAEKMIDFLLQNGCKPTTDSDGTSLLMRSLSVGPFDTDDWKPFKMVLEKLPDQLQMLDKEGRNALFHCMSIMDFQDLISMGIDPSVRCKSNGDTVVHHFARSQNMAIKYLVDILKFDASKVNNEGKTILHLICEPKNDPFPELQAILSFTDKSAVNIQDNMGNTALHYEKTSDIRNKLLSLGANPKIKNNKGTEALFVPGGNILGYTAHSSASTEIPEKPKNIADLGAKPDDICFQSLEFQATTQCRLHVDGTFHSLSFVDCHDNGRHYKGTLLGFGNYFIDETNKQITLQYYHFKDDDKYEQKTITEVTNDYDGTFLKVRVCFNSSDNVKRMWNESEWVFTNYQNYE